MIARRRKPKRRRIYRWHVQYNWLTIWDVTTKHRTLFGALLHSATVLFVEGGRVTVIDTKE